MKFKKLIAVALFGCFTATTAQAELFGPGFGRTANLDNAAQLSVEGGANLGGDVTFFGGRVNYKVSPDLMVYGDVGRAEFFDADGFAFGVGAIYQLRDVSLLENTDFAVRGSFHSGSLEIDGCQSVVSTGVPGFDINFDCDVDVTELAVNALISGDQLSTTDFAWYASAGFHNLDGGGSDSFELGLSAGIVGDLAFGEWFAGAELVDEFYVTAGVRYNLN